MFIQLRSLSLSCPRQQCLRRGAKSSGMCLLSRYLQFSVAGPAVSNRFSGCLSNSLTHVFQSHSRLK